MVSSEILSHHEKTKSQNNENYKKNKALTPVMNQMPLKWNGHSPAIPLCDQKHTLNSENYSEMIRTTNCFTSLS